MTITQIRKGCAVIFRELKQIIFTYWLNLDEKKRTISQITFSLFGTAIMILFHHFSTHHSLETGSFDLMDYLPIGMVGFSVTMLFSILWTKDVQKALELKRANEQLNVLNEKLQKQNVTDHLTGLHNLYYITEIAPSMIRQAARNNRFLTHIMIDVDDLKFINDTYGHPAGDMVLQAVAERLINKFRAADCIARTGGDEFRILAEVENPIGFQKKIEEKLKSFSIKFDSHTIAISVSWGCAYKQVADMKDGQNWHNYIAKIINLLYAAADDAMYEYKMTKKGNRIS